MDTKGGVVVPPLFFDPERGVFRSCGSDQRRRLWKLLSEGTRRVAGAVLFPCGGTRQLRCQSVFRVTPTSPKRLYLPCGQISTAKYGGLFPFPLPNAPCPNRGYGAVPLALKP